MVVILSEESNSPALASISQKLTALTGTDTRIVSGTCAGIHFVLVPDAGDEVQQKAQAIEGVRSIFPAKDLPEAEALLRRVAGYAARAVDDKRGTDAATKLKVAFQGARGAYSQTAVAQLFANQSYELAPRAQFKDVFEAVQSGECDLGVLPFENALTGSIHENYDLLLQYPDLGIHGETFVRIRHNLIALPEASIEDIKKVFSHPQGLLQSARFLDAHPNWERIAFYDTAGSVEHVKQVGSKENAAIAGAAAAEVYGMKILADGIESNQNNFTRFCILGRRESNILPEPAKIDALKASIVFSLPHRPGSLLHCMQAIGDQELNLTKIESRPIHGKPWEYMFYIDVDIGGAIDRFHLALHLLTGITEDLRVLGLYPRA